MDVTPQKTIRNKSTTKLKIKSKLNAKSKIKDAKDIKSNNKSKKNRKKKNKSSKSVKNKSNKEVRSKIKDIGNDNVTKQNAISKENSISTDTRIKPLLKWVGGKSQIMDTLIREFPKEMDNYHEIFLGGGSVLLAVLNCVNSGLLTIKNKIYAYDLNAPLIHVYKNIQTDHMGLYEFVRNMVNEYHECTGTNVIRKPTTLEESKTSSESYYYWIRTKYNELSETEKTGIAGSAMFIFLNKTCFRGLFRVGPKGFNVPYGHYKKPQIIDKQHLIAIHNLIQDVTFITCSFTESMKNIGPNDFAYLDPPYAPENSKSFTKYTGDGFGVKLHEELFNMCNELNNDNKKFLMSNSNVELVTKNFPSSQYTIIVITCKRSINSKNPAAKTEEVLIRSY